MYEHEWVLNEYGDTDIFALDEGFHNGPECARCHRIACQHCEPDVWDEQCPVVALQPTLPIFEEQ